MNESGLPASTVAVTTGSAAVAMPEDYGCFGPGSVTWKVWSYPTSLTIGFQRAVVIEELDPFLIAPVNITQKIVSKARVRYDNTLRYFAIVAFGDTRTVVKAADALVRIHAKMTGVEPVSGLHFDANNPDSQLWIHMTAWHSILYAYEVYGPGKLGTEEENRYWEECAVAAQFQTCDPKKVPRTRAGVQQYFERMRPRLAASEAAQGIMDHLLNADVMFPPLPAVMKPGAWVVNRVLRAMTLATMPAWQRKLAGLPQWNLTAWLARTAGKMMFRTFAALTSKRMQWWMLGQISPATAPVVRHVLLNEPVKTPEVLTPEQAFAKHHTAMPAEQYQELRMSADKAAQVVYTPSSPVPM